MAETTQGGGATTADGSAKAAATTTVEATEVKTVKYDDHKRALDDLHRFKTEAKEAKAQLEQVQQDNLKKAQDFKTLWENEQKLRTDAEAGLGKLKNAIVNNEKYTAIKTAAMKAGLRADAVDMLDHIPVEGVEVEATNQGRFLVHGADTFVEHLKKKMPFAFSNTETPKFNGGGASGSAKAESITAAQLVSIQRTDPAKYPAAMRQYMEQQRKNAVPNR